MLFTYGGLLVGIYIVYIATGLEPVLFLIIAHSIHVARLDIMEHMVMHRVLHVALGHGYTHLFSVHQLRVVIHVLRGRIITLEAVFRARLATTALLDQISRVNYKLVLLVFIP